MYLSINKQNINWMLNKFEIQGVKGPKKNAIKTVKVAKNVLDDNKRGKKNRRKKTKIQPLNNWLRGCKVNQYMYIYQGWALNHLQKSVFNWAGAWSANIQWNLAFVHIIRRQNRICRFEGRKDMCIMYNNKTKNKSNNNQIVGQQPQQEQ